MNGADRAAECQHDTLLPVHGMSLRTNDDDDDEDLVYVNALAFHFPMTALSGTMVRSTESGSQFQYSQFKI